MSRCPLRELGNEGKLGNEGNTVLRSHGDAGTPAPVGCRVSERLPIPACPGPLQGEQKRWGHEAEVLDVLLLTLLFCSIFTCGLPFVLV